MTDIPTHLNISWKHTVLAYVPDSDDRKVSFLAYAIVIRHEHPDYPYAVYAVETNNENKLSKNLGTCMVFNKCSSYAEALLCLSEKMSLSQW